MTSAQETARQQIRRLIEKYRALSDMERKALSETNVVNQFITPLLEALGWPIQDPQRFKYELNLGTFPLVFPDDANGQAKKAAVLRVYDRFGQTDTLLL